MTVGHSFIALNISHIMTRRHFVILHACMDISNFQQTISRGLELNIHDCTVYTHFIALYCPEAGVCGNEVADESH